MGKTIIEKIIGEHCGKAVSAGEFVVANVDVTAVQDGTGPLTVQEKKSVLNRQRILLEPYYL